MPVQDLKPGDRVLTLHGEGARFKPVVWIGRSRFDATRHPDPDQVYPIRVTAGALGDDAPHRDLLVSPGHSLLIDGVLIQAERLVNGATIIRDRSMTRGEYFHVELAQHDILLSEGVPSESYLDTGNRSAFSNGGARVDLHPDFSPRHWTETCVPLVQDGPVLDAIRQRLIARAETLGWTRTATVRASVTIDGRPDGPIWQDGSKVRFRVPRGSKQVRLRSAAGVPAECLAEAGDRRRLGLLVDGVAVIRGRLRQEWALDDPRLGDGWYGVERNDEGAWRWTDGDAVVAVSGPCMMEFSVVRCLPSWEARPDTLSELNVRSG